MSPPLQVALDLQSAGASCAAKNHFDRAQREGDERSLALLKQLTTAHQIKQAGFRKTDLLACLHDGQLARTIAALEERLRVEAASSARRSRVSVPVDASAAARRGPGDARAGDERDGERDIATSVSSSPCVRRRCARGRG